jgi:two-component system cell cycle sensor histidine kinase/response regulator CckA
MNSDQRFDPWSADEPTRNGERRSTHSSPNQIAKFSKFVTDRLPVLRVLNRKHVNRINVTPVNNSPSKNRKWLSQRRAGAVGCFLVLVLGLSLLTLDLQPGMSLKFASYDSSYLWWSFTHTKPPQSDIVLVYLDEASHLDLQQPFNKPWNRAIHADLLNRLTADGAKAVIFDIVFSDPGPDEKADQAFADAIRKNGKVILAADYSRNPSSLAGSQFDEMTLTQPWSPFLEAGAHWGLSGLHPDEDFVVREHWHGLPERDYVSLSWAAARMLGLSAAHDTNSLQLERWVNYYGGASSLSGISYKLALKESPGFFRDKIVFIGARPMTGLLRERRDEWRSPYTTWYKAPVFYPAVDVHAFCLLNLIRGDWLTRMSPAGEWMGLLAAALFFGYGLTYFRPWLAVGIALLGTVLFAVGAILLFGVAHIWFPWLIIVAAQAPAGLLWSFGYKSLDWYVQRRALEEQRRRAELRIRKQAALLDKAQDAIMVLDTNGRSLYWNASAERLYGWTADEARQQNIEELLCSRDGDSPTAARNVASEKGEWTGRLRQKTKIGKDIFVDSRWTRVIGESGAPEFLIINTDVTEKTKLEAQLFRTQRMESIGTLAGGIAHDLNNILSPIMMGVQLLEMKESDESRKKMLTTISTSAKRGADMVKQVLTFARGQDGERVVLQLKHVIREMEKMANETFPKSVRVSSNIATDLQPIKADATQLHQVLLNLCVNARDAMPDGGSISIEAKNIILTEEWVGRLMKAAPGPYVSLRVTDTGTGIPLEIMDRIFEPFFTTKEVGKGTGLGLATTIGIVKSHQAFLEVTSQVGKGTTFTILFPPAEPSALKNAQEVRPADLKGRGDLILVVDDEELVRKMIEIGLTQHNYRVLLAENGQQAVTLFKRHGQEIRTVVIDRMMPVMDGIKAIAAIRAIKPETKFILISGLACEDDHKLGLNKNEILRKPFSTDKLLETIRDTLNLDMHRRIPDESSVLSIRTET